MISNCLLFSTTARRREAAGAGLRRARPREVRRDVLRDGHTPAERPDYPLSVSATPRDGGWCIGPSRGSSETARPTWPFALPPKARAHSSNPGRPCGSPVTGHAVVDDSRIETSCFGSDDGRAADAPSPRCEYVAGMSRHSCRRSRSVLNLRRLPKQQRPLQHGAASVKIAVDRVRLVDGVVIGFISGGSADTRESCARGRTQLFFELPIAESTNEKLPRRRESACRERLIWTQRNARDNSNLAVRKCRVKFRRSQRSKTLAKSRAANRSQSREPNAVKCS